MTRLPATTSSLRTTALLLLAGALGGGALGCGPRVTAPAPVGHARISAARGDAPAGWRAGESAIQVGDLKEMVGVLASDDEDGRETLTPGAHKAADYLARRFAALGLAHLPGQASYQVDYTLDEMRWDADRTRLRWKRPGMAEVALRPGVDFAPLAGAGGGGAVAGDLVFAGYGLEKPSAGWNDYAGLNVRGKVVLVLRHVPHEAMADKKGAKLSMADGAFAAKAEAARKHGAVGMIVVTEASHARDEHLSMVAYRRVPEAEGAEGEGGGMRPGAGAAPGGPAPALHDRGAHRRGRHPGARAGRRGAAHRGPFVEAMMSRDAAARLLAGADRTLAQLQAAVEGGTPPRALPIGRVHVTLSAHADPTPHPVTAHNVLAMLPGADPARRDQWVVIGGHYDHLGEGGLDQDDIFNGADDNASGTAGVMELARAFASLAPADRPARPLVFACFSGEEMGLFGSSAALREGDIPVKDVVFMVNLDMIGRNPTRPVDVLGDAYATGVRALTERANKTLGIHLHWLGLGSARDLTSSDHFSFFLRGVPDMFLFTGEHADYHQVTDTPDKLSYERMARLVHLAYRVAGAVAATEVTPRFIHQVPWLGAALVVQDQAGIRRPIVTRVAPGSRAARAGLTVGDALISVGPQPLYDPDQIGRVLDQAPAGKLALVVARGGKTVELDVDKVKRGLLGVIPGDPGLSPEQRKTLGLGRDQGVALRAVVPDGPAAHAGLRAGDLLIELGGQPIGPTNLMRRLSVLGAGSRVPVVALRSGSRVEATVELGAAD